MSKALGGSLRIAFGILDNPTVLAIRTGNTTVYPAIQRGEPFKAPKNTGSASIYVQQLFLLLLLLLPFVYEVRPNRAYRTQPTHRNPMQSSIQTHICAHGTPKSNAKSVGFPKGPHCGPRGDLDQISHRDFTSSFHPHCQYQCPSRSCHRLRHRYHFPRHSTLRELHASSVVSVVRRGQRHRRP